MNFSGLPGSVDIVIAGGGITGAGVFREAVRMGLRAVLVEQKDYAWGTSSKSSKLIHGGLRYLKEGKFHLTMDSVIHRERLVREAPGLVSSLGFYLPVYAGKSPGKLVLEAGLTIYDLMSRKKQHCYLDNNEFMEKVPGLRNEGLKGGFFFHDAQVNDAGLVQRLINEAVELGGLALNYTRLAKVHRNSRGKVSAVTIQDAETGEACEIKTGSVINSTGAWAENIMKSPNPAYHLRPLRGSHLVFPGNAFPFSDAVTIVHPRDKRPLFIIPWESVYIFGTTDIDHKKDLNTEPSMTKQEASYLLEALDYYFGSYGKGIKDAVSSFAGIRPVLSRGNVPPSQESREHAVWKDNGLITVTGGKLTTFRKLAWDALKAASPFLPDNSGISQNQPVFTKNADIESGAGGLYGLPEHAWKRICGRYGDRAHKIIEDHKNRLSVISGSEIRWAEVGYSASTEQIRHISDLLLRRTRLGLVLPDGGACIMEDLGEILKPALGWDDMKWAEEKEAYKKEWQLYFSPPKI